VTSALALVSELAEVSGGQSLELAELSEVAAASAVTSTEALALASAATLEGTLVQSVTQVSGGGVHVRSHGFGVDGVEGGEHVTSHGFGTDGVDGGEQLMSHGLGTVGVGTLGTQSVSPPAAAPPKSITPNSRPYKGMRDRRLRPILQSFLFSMGFHLRASQDSLGRSKARPHIGAMCWGDGACAVRGLSCRDVPGEIRAGTSGGALLG